MVGRFCFRLASQVARQAIHEVGCVIQLLALHCLCLGVGIASSRVERLALSTLVSFEYLPFSSSRVCPEPSHLPSCNLPTSHLVQSPAQFDLSRHSRLNIDDPTNEPSNIDTLSKK